MFEEGPVAVAAEAVLSLRLRLAEMYPPRGPTSNAAYRETVEASLEYVLAPLIQFFTLDKPAVGRTGRAGEAACSVGHLLR